MSTSFEARFSTTRLPLPEVLLRLEPVLESQGLQFFGAVAPLVARRGWPTVAGLDFVTVPALATLADHTRGWWGVGIELVSRPLVEAIRTSDAEVYLNLFPGPGGGWTLSYLESDAVEEYRGSSEEAARALVQLQQSICASCGFELSLYDEQDHSRAPVPTLRAVENAVRRRAQDSGLGDLCAVVAASSLPFERALNWAGARAGEVRLSTDGYVIFPFLRPGVG